jgi:type IV secretory pathway VirB2 component (pilin)
MSLLARILEHPRFPLFIQLAIYGFIAFHPAPALAQQNPFSSLTNNICNFKGALVDVAGALTIIGLVTSGVGWMTRSHEGLGPVFWGGITMVGAGSLILLGDNFVQAIQGQGGNSFVCPST